MHACSFPGALQASWQAVRKTKRDCLWDPCRQVFEGGRAYLRQGAAVLVAANGQKALEAIHPSALHKWVGGCGSHDAADGRRGCHAAGAQAAACLHACVLAGMNSSRGVLL